MNTILAALVNGAILGALLTTGLWLVLFLAPRRILNAATRYAIWWAMLGIVVLLPMIYLPVRHSVRASAMSIRPQTPAPIQRFTPRVAPVTRIDRADPPVYKPAIPIRQIPVSKTTPSIVWPKFPLEITAARWSQWIFVGWLFGSLLLLVRLALSCVLLDRLRARAIDAPRALWMTAIVSAARRRIRVASSAEIAIPVAVGPRRPSILIPAKLFIDLEERELEQIVLHEAAHLARRDDYALLAQRILEALFVWHPVVWWIVRRIDLEREIACDDLVIAATGQPRPYASCLTRIVELSAGVRSSLAAATAADDTSHLARRVDMLLDKKRHFGTRLLKGRFAAIAAMLAALVSVASQIPALVAFGVPRTAAAAQSFVAQIPKLLMQAATSATDQPNAEGLVVEDSSGSGMASAEVRFRKLGMRELVADLDTDRTDRFRASGLPPGDYTIDFSKPNYITTTLKTHLPATGLVVRLVRFGVIDGQVLDIEGNGVPGRVLENGGRTAGSARITVLVKTPGSEQLREFRQISLEEDGRFRIFDLPPGEYTVGLWYSGLKEGSGMQLYPDNSRPRSFTVAGGEDYRDINFSISPRSAYQVSGKIELPKPKTQFQLALGLPDQPTLPIAQTLTKEDGSFQFAKVPTGSYDLFVAGPTGGYGAFDSILGPDEPLFGRMRIQVAGQDIENVTVPIGPARSFNVALRSSGSASAPEGCPKSVSVSVQSLEPWAILFRNTSQVSFAAPTAIPNLAPGRFRLTTSGLGAGCYQVNQPEIDLNTDVANPVVLELASAGSVRGTLKIESGRPSDFAVVLLNPELLPYSVMQPLGATGGAETQLAFPDAQGHFRFEGLRPGRYRISAKPAAQASKVRWISDASQMAEIEVPGGAPVAIELPATTKGGRP